MNSKEWLRKKGIHPTEPIYWDFIHSTISLDELLEEYALYKQLQNTSSNSDYAAAVKNLINSEVDCVQTKNGAYVNLDGVIDCLNRALHDFA